MTNTKKGLYGLTIGALGVVFGDIGTSPLYAMQAIFGRAGKHLAINQSNVYGIVSLVIWSVIIIVSMKYICFIMRADNKGEGGIMALTALIKSSSLRPRLKWLFILLGIIGVSLFYGDSAITPAISVLSAVEGLKVVAPSLHSFILPITLIILGFLFGIQRYGTALIGRLFGPVMLSWFAVIAAGGILQIWQHPAVLTSLTPLPAFLFVISQPFAAFIALGAVILTVTGAEALYADMGHFGRQPIAKAWFLVVFPSLALCYMGQGALLLNDQHAISSPLVLMFPSVVRIPVILLATLATLIASQAVISGAFSLTRQAIQLAFLPKMLVRHTSAREIGQIYIPFINAALFVAVTFLVLTFGSSERLAGAYGMAVSATLAIDTILFLVVARVLWQKSVRYIASMIVIFLLIDLLFVASNLPKLLSGGWFPILVAILVLTLITTWAKGQEIISKQRRALEGSLQAFIDKIKHAQPPITRVPGYAIFVGHHADFAPLALHAAVEKLHELQEKVIIVSVEITTLSHVPEDKRAVFDNLQYDDGISHISLSYGFHDTPNIPKTLRSLRHLNPEINFDLDEASYFISLSKVVPTKSHSLSSWRKTLYSLMAQNALSASDYYKLPIERTVEMRSLIKL